MDPNSLPPEVQEALQRRQNAPQGGQPQPAPQAPPQVMQPPIAPPMPAQDPSQMAPATPEIPFDVQEVKMIEGALINRLKALTDAQFPKEPTEPSQIFGGQ